MAYFIKALDWKKPGQDMVPKHMTHWPTSYQLFFTFHFNLSTSIIILSIHQVIKLSITSEHPVPHLLLVNSMDWPCPQ